MLVREQEDVLSRARLRIRLLLNQFIPEFTRIRTPGCEHRDDRVAGNGDTPGDATDRAHITRNSFLDAVQALEEAIEISLEVCVGRGERLTDGRYGRGPNVFDDSGNIIAFIRLACDLQQFRGSRRRGGANRS